MSVFLMISLIGLIQHPEQSAWSVLPFFFQQMGLGLIIGWVLAQALLHFLQRFPLDHEGITPVLSISFAVLTYGVADLVGGSGFLAVYILALLIGNDEFLHKRYMTRFHDGMAWLMQIVMFVLLGLLVNPSQLLPVSLTALSITAFRSFWLAHWGRYLRSPYPKEAFAISFSSLGVGFAARFQLFWRRFPCLQGYRLRANFLTSFFSWSRVRPYPGQQYWSCRKMAGSPTPI